MLSRWQHLSWMLTPKPTPTPSTVSVGPTWQPKRSQAECAHRLELTGVTGPPAPETSFHYFQLSRALSKRAVTSFPHIALYPNFQLKEKNGMNLLTSSCLLSLFTSPPAKPSCCSFCSGDCRKRLHPTSLSLALTCSPTQGLPTAQVPRPIIPPCGMPCQVLLEFVVVWQEVAQLAILTSPEDLFQQILLAEAIAI